LIAALRTGLLNVRRSAIAIPGEEDSGLDQEVTAQGIPFRRTVAEAREAANQTPGDEN